MKVTSLVLLVCLFATAIMASDVLTLTNDNFDSTVTENPLVLVEFYAPWCGHCKTLAPKYEVAATQLKGVAPIAKVDCTSVDTLCNRFGVRGYPTLKLFRNGAPQEYTAGRETDAIVSFMKKQVLPAVSVLSGDKVKSFSESEKVVVIGFFSSESDPEYAVFSEVANSLRDSFLFGATTDAEALKAFEVEAPGVILFKKFDEHKNVFDEPFNKAQLTEFVKANSVPTMDDIGPQNYQSYVDSGLPLAYLFVTAEQRPLVGPQVEPVAKEFKGKLNFVYIDANQYGGHATNVNLKVGEWPGFSIHQSKENNKFPFSGEITTENIRKHVQGVLDGSIKPHVKSQPAPETQGNVKVIVGTNYHEIVKAGKNVLVEFYAPWCGHCKKLTPIYDELGDFYANNENIVIAKMDATENDLPAGTPFQVQGFPTIKLIKADGAIVSYEGDRSLNSFKEFLQSNIPQLSASSQSATKDEL